MAPSLALSAGSKKVEGFDVGPGVFLFGVNMFLPVSAGRFWWVRRVLWYFIILLKHIGNSKLAVTCHECLFVWRCDLSMM